MRILARLFCNCINRTESEGMGAHFFKIIINTNIVSVLAFTLGETLMFT